MTPEKKRVNSRVKGAAGELEVAKLIRTFGFDAKRSQQHSGAAGDEDVFHSIPGVYLEVKFYKDCKLFAGTQLAEWKQQMVKDSSGFPVDTLRVIVHRWNGQTEWYALCFGQPNGIFSEDIILKFRSLLALIKRGVL